MPPILRLFVMLTMCLVLPHQASAHTVITRMSDRQNIGMSQLAADAGGSDVVLVGEAHDNKDHHDMQLELIRSIHAANPGLAIGLEMIQAHSQRALDEWSAGRMPESAMQAVFEKNWSPDWAMYREIFLFARDNRIPMVALNVPAEIVKKVSQHGFESLTAEERKGLPEGTSCDLRNPQIAMLRKAFHKIGSHLGEGKVFKNFCEAQTVRNSGMALNTDRYLKKHPGRTVVVLTGIWHAVKYGIPDQLERNSSTLSYTVILPETPELSTETSSTSEADYLVEL